jgi:hypothetical protein
LLGKLRRCFGHLKGDLLSLDAKLLHTDRLTGGFGNLIGVHSAGDCNSNAVLDGRIRRKVGDVRRKLGPSRILALFVL